MPKASFFTPVLIAGCTILTRSFTPVWGIGVGVGAFSAFVRLPIHGRALTPHPV